MDKNLNFYQLPPPRIFFAPPGPSLPPLALGCWIYQCRLPVGRPGSQPTSNFPALNLHSIV